MFHLRSLAYGCFFLIDVQGYACLLSHLMTADHQFMVHVTHSTPDCLSGKSTENPKIRVGLPVAFDIEIIPMNKEVKKKLPSVSSLSLKQGRGAAGSAKPRVRLMSEAKFFADNIVFESEGEWTFDLVLQNGAKSESLSFKAVVQPVIAKKQKKEPDQFVPSFELKSLTGEAVTLNSLKGKVWIAQYFFTSCPTICPVMTARMAILQKEFKGFPDFRSVSVTTDPDVDTIDAIKKFASLHHADLSSWYFLRGTKEQMIALSSGGLGLGGEMKTPAHSVQFALVDKTGKIRGRFDPRVPNEMKELQKNVRELLSGKQ